MDLELFIYVSQFIDEVNADIPAIEREMLNQRHGARWQREWDERKNLTQ